MRQNEANLLMWKYIFMVSKTLHFVVKKGLEATLVFLCVQTNPKRFSLSQWYRLSRVSGIPIPKTLPIWASPVTLTLTQLAISNMRRDAHFTRVLAMRMPKTRGCPYHCNIATPETIRGMSTSFGATISGIVWVDKRYLWLVNSCPGYHRPMITNACVPKQSQKLLHLKLVLILARASEVDKVGCVSASPSIVYASPRPLGI